MNLKAISTMAGDVVNITGYDTKGRVFVSYIDKHGRQRNTWTLIKYLHD